MITIATLFLIVALIAFVAASIPVPTRINLVALGLAFLTCFFLLNQLGVVR